MRLNEKIYEYGLVKTALMGGGKIKPLCIPLNYSESVALMNPSIINENGNLLVNLRATNYTLWHSETSRYPHLYGPLQYIHPTHDICLATENYLCTLDYKLDIDYYHKIDMRLNKPPKWEFHGLEDVRLVTWNDNLWITGCRRDTTPNGQSRMELSRINWNNGNPYESNRFRIPAPDDTVYCEKNWMPIIDKPFYYIKWSNPTELAKFDLISRSTVSELRGENKKYTQFRGGTQLIPWNNKYICIGHTVEFLTPKWGQKDARYYAHLAIFSNNFELEYVSDPFKFMNGAIEFQCGICTWEDYFLITFAYEDNAAYLVAIKFNDLLI